MVIRILIFTVTALWLASCGSKSATDAWEGDENTSAEEQISRKNCECLMDFFKSKGINTDMLLKYAYRYDKNHPPKTEKEMKEQFPGLLDEMTKIESEKSGFGNYPCAVAVGKEAQSMPLNEEKMVREFNNRCNMQKFMF